MNGRMGGDGWMDRGTAGRTNGQALDRWMDRQTDGEVDGWIGRWMDGQTNGWMDKWTGRRMNGWTNELMDGPRDGQKDGWMERYASTQKITSSRGRQRETHRKNCFFSTVCTKGSFPHTKMASAKPAQ